MLFKLGFTFILAVISQVQSACNSCDQTTHVACYNETTFQVCFVEDEATPSIENINECPTGTVCVQTNKKICVDRETPGVTPSCVSECGKCNADKVFACMSSNEFSFCYGTDNPLGPNIRCPEGRVCRNGVPNYCELASDDPQQAAPSCADGEIGTTTTAPQTSSTDGTQTEPTPPTSPTSPTSPTPPTSTRPPTINEFCVNQATVGRYALPNDTTCRRYIYCYFLSGRLVGQEFQCPEMTHFNPAGQVCVTLNQSTCIPTV